MMATMVLSNYQLAMLAALAVLAGQRLDHLLGLDGEPAQAPEEPPAQALEPVQEEQPEASPHLSQLITLTHKYIDVCYIDA